ncbi:MAG: hypothetical protein ACP5N7_02025 [Candidatus Pacearchaeota archaeon]
MKVSYDTFKDFIDKRRTDILMIELDDRYHIYTTEDALSIEVMLVKNTDEALDFEENLKASCNPDKYNKDEMIAWGKFSDIIDSSQYDEENPKVIDVKFPDNLGYSFYNFFGAWVHVANYGDFDHILFQLVDKDNVLGYGANTVLKEYCELWSVIVEKTTIPIYAPNKSAGRVFPGLYARLIYYPTDVTKTNIKFWGKFVTTVE